MTDRVRPAAARIAHTRHRLETDENIWIATASPRGVPHLVPLSLTWDGRRIILATPTATPTVRNIAATGAARASLDDADDVVIIAAAATVVPVAAATGELLDAFARRTGWDPRRQAGEEWSMLILGPTMIHAWHGEPEIAARTIMRDGSWIE